jgi:L-arabinose isomerase
MSGRPVKVGILLTLAELYRRNRPQIPGELALHWRKTIAGIVGTAADLQYSDVVCTVGECREAVATCEQNGCSLIVILPMAYTPSQVCREALIATRLPLLLLSTSVDPVLPVSNAGEFFLRNQGLHAVQDLANVLRRASRPFDVLAGHPSQDRFRALLMRKICAAQGASVLSAGRIGQIGGFFEGMLDFRFDAKARGLATGFAVVQLTVADLQRQAETIGEARIAEFVSWMHERFDTGTSVTADESEDCARLSLALEDIVERRSLNGVSMNFLALLDGGARTLPFLGASRLLARGVGYAGEGDVMTAALVAAVARFSSEVTFSELYLPEYERGRILLSHMGESNYDLAADDRPRLAPREFPWGRCERPLVPVVRLRSGVVTLATITEGSTETSGLPYRLIVARGAVEEDEPLRGVDVPYGHFRPEIPLEAFVEASAAAGGTHHVALSYGDHLAELTDLASSLGLQLTVL